MPKRKAKKAKKPQRGGVRAGAGRKPEFDQALEATICLRVTGEQKQALKDFIESAAFNVKREKKGLKKIDLATWLRELGLKHSGNEHLGMAAKVHAQAESLANDSIV